MAKPNNDVSSFTSFPAMFDEQFTISDFSSAVDESAAQSNRILSTVRDAIQAASMKEEPETNLVVDMSAELKEAFSDGEVKLVTGKNGEVYGQLRNSNGQFGKRLSLKETLSNEGITAEDVNMALQMEAIKSQLQTIITDIKKIEGRVTEVIQGQRNDRMGLFYSGLSLFLEARNIGDEYLKKQIIAQALRSINDANAQMIQDLKSSLTYLIDEQYRTTKRPTEKISEQLCVIHQCYDVIYRSAFLKATIYQECGEVKAMLTSIDEYSRFVEVMIIPYTGMLSELDRNEQFIEQGAWGTIAHTLNGCKHLEQMLTDENTYVLSMEEEKNAD